ncbi:hypothetical protein [Chitinophaga tropicalis]|uniref:Uncharacterized protein n=1 Tax=Chitinophaga tropicalis TaxID=2683588 RepID=A0A7K1UCQ7_9BACT|nr:hypothetical protein [Chitinophaga tropicalis]MVT12060.1 hypothetical protein [Chitinophaga tropicalis]
MSQPVGIIAKVFINEDGYKKYLKKVAPGIAKEIFEELNGGGQIFHMLRYIKKEQALYGFFYFNHGNSAFLKESPYKQVLLDIEPFLEADSHGYLTATLDSLNLSQDDCVYSLGINNRKWVDRDIPEKEWKAIVKETWPNFFKYAVEDENYSRVLLSAKKIMDKTVQRAYIKVQEEHRVKKLKEEYHLATPLKPMLVFENYYYNGKDFYYCNGPAKEIKFFSNINLQELMKEPYGLHDSRHVIIDDNCIETDPASFKMLHRAYTTYYIAKDMVYDDKLNPMPMADAATFKLNSEWLASDKNYLYLNKTPILQEDLGSYTLPQKIVFYDEILLAGSKQVWLGNEQVKEIDATSFTEKELSAKEGKIQQKIVEKWKNSLVAPVIKYGEDKDGPLVIVRFNKYKNRFFPAQSLQGVPLGKALVIRKSSEQFLDWLKQCVDEIEKLNAEVSFFSIEGTYDYESTHRWLVTNLASSLPGFAYNNNCLRNFNNHLYFCWKLYEESGRKDTSSLEKGLEWFSHLKPYHSHYLNPYLNHHLACFYVALGNYGEAIKYVAAAWFSGYELFNKIMVDNDLQPLFDRPDFIMLKEAYANLGAVPGKGRRPRWKPDGSQYPYLNEHVVAVLEQMPAEYATGVDEGAGTDYLVTLVCTFAIYEWPDEQKELTEQEKQRLELYRRFRPYFNRYMQQNGSKDYYSDNIYDHYMNSRWINAESHLVRLESLFKAAHGQYSYPEFLDKIMPVFEQLKNAITRDNETPEVIERIKRSIVLQMLELDGKLG